MPVRPGFPRNMGQLSAVATPDDAAMEAESADINAKTAQMSHRCKMHDLCSMRLWLSADLAIRLPTRWPRSNKIIRTRINFPSHERDTRVIETPRSRLCREKSLRGSKPMRQAT